MDVCKPLLLGCFPTTVDGLTVLAVLLGLGPVPVARHVIACHAKL